ncbi:uncharacterized protein LOC106642617 [Copidosoma floridanum]|uniref:uncharacterized protein LOC106642617 n=1 Tax=Copidosoma floridanum TaxID=29053 RepID=UPI0006C9C5A3|nr:uncharacterized protein LOC106642617 [Copidosoma floridanum]
MVPKKEESLYLVNEPSKYVIALSSDESDETSDKNYNTRRKANTVTVVHQKISEPFEFKRSSSCKVYNSKQNDFKKPQSCLSDAISTKRLNKCFKNRVSKTVGSDEHSLESRKISENNCLDNQNLVTFAQIKNNQLSSTILRSVEESTTKIKKKDFLLANGKKGSLLKKSIDKMSLKKRKKSVDCSDEDDIFVPLSKKPPTNESESEDKTCNNVPLVNKGIQLYESNNNFNSADNITSKENLNPIKACRRSLMYYKKNSDDKYTKKLRTRLKRTDYRSSSEVCVSSDEEYFVPLKMYG